MDNYKVDVTGDDIFTKGYGIIVVFNNKEVYGYKLPSDLQTNIMKFFKDKKYGFTNHKHLKPKTYSAILTLLVEKIVKENITETKDFQFNLCNDFSGHENNIAEILRGHFTRMNLFEKFTADNYSWVRHPKKSLIQKSALKMYRNDWTGINKVVLDSSNIHNLIAKRKHYRKKW